MARLQIDLRFRLLSLVTIISSTTTVLLSVLFAYLGLGPYSFILPMPLVAALRTTILLAAERPAVRPRLQFRRWRYLLGDSGLAIATVVCIAVSMQGTISSSAIATATNRSGSTSSPSTSPRRRCSCWRRTWRA